VTAPPDTPLRVGLLGAGWISRVHLTALRAVPEGRLFLWLHLYDPHDPYEPPEPYATRYAERPYDGEVAYSDDLVGRLLAALDRLDFSDEELAEIDRYAVDTGINIWAGGEQLVERSRR